MNDHTEDASARTVLDRRTFVAVAGGAVGLPAVAGCLDDDDEPDQPGIAPGNGTGTPEGNESATGTPIDDGAGDEAPATGTPTDDGAG